MITYSTLGIRPTNNPIRGLCTLALLASLLAAAFGAKASPIQPPAVEPEHRPYLGSLQLAVDATDCERKIIHIHEHIHHPETEGNELTLAYPKWLPGTHAPEGPIDRVAGFKFTANGRTLHWQRDPLDVFLFHVKEVSSNDEVDIEFDYLSPTSSKVGPQEISNAITTLEWNALTLYPINVWARDIPVTLHLKLPLGYEYGTALELDSEAVVDGWIAFKPTDFETLIDSPVYSGKYSKTISLNHIANVDGATRARTHLHKLPTDDSSDPPVKLHVFADRASGLDISNEAIQSHRSLVTQANLLYGSHHYRHYDFLLTVSNQIQEIGLEHHQSSEDGAGFDYFSDWSKTIAGRDLLAHEYTHSWNGKFRRPADLFTANYHVPMQDSLLWVYEGQTQYWGEVLTARSGLWTTKQATEAIALTAAYYANQAGRQWRSVADTTNDEIINPRRPLSWEDWQRFEDYYSEGFLVWLEADTLIREQSHGTKSLDDFAKAFFGVNDGQVFTETYTYQDVVSALTQVLPYDWNKFLLDRIYTVNAPAPIMGLERAGYKLVYNNTPNDIMTAKDHEGGHASFRYSLGMIIDDHGKITDVLWGGLGFSLGLAEGMDVISINGSAYSSDKLTELLKKSTEEAVDLELIVKADDQYKVLKATYRGGLKVPHLERIKDKPDLLENILRAKSAP